MKKRKLNKAIIILYVVSALCFFAAIFRCFEKIETNLKQEMYYTLSDMAEQDVLAVKKEMKAKYRVLSSIAMEMENHPEGEAGILSSMRSFVEIYNFKRMGYAEADGLADTTDGFQIDISDRRYFKEGMQGKLWLSDTLVDPTNDEHELIHVFSVPVYEAGHAKVKGVLFATYRMEDFQELLHTDTFAGSGFSCIMWPDGKVIAHSPNSPLSEVENIFDYIREISPGNGEVAAQSEENMKQGLTSSGSYEGNSMSLLFHYRPLGGVSSDQQWYILTIAPQAALSERVAPIKRDVKRMLVIVIVIFLIAVLSAIVANYRKRRILTSLAYQDGLTGGDNFLCFKEKCKNRKSADGFLIAMDLSEFKVINDTCGVEKGDEALVALWKILSAHTMAVEGELLARVNADRFVMLWEAAGKVEVESRLQEIIAEILKLSEQLKIPKLFPVFGIYQIEKMEEADNLYGNAVQAKHLVKGRRDRHYAFYDEIDRAMVLENRKLEDSFEQALRDREFQVWYQPKYSTMEGKIIGAEALVRWRKADGKMLAPGRFISLFEKNGNITALDEYVFRTVCMQQKKWEKEGKELRPVSVNISRVSLYFSNIVDKYREILREIDLNPSLVELEITESATIDNAEIASLITGFRDAGFKILLDDFGSGYSSLATLNMMHFDTLKLDKSLVDYIGDENGEKLLHYITRLGQSLGLRITAEGVETENQLTFLRDLQCDDIQGYYFSKPLPLEEYEERLNIEGKG